MTLQHHDSRTPSFPALCRKIAESSSDPQMQDMALLAESFSAQLAELKNRICHPSPADLIFIRHGNSEANTAKSFREKLDPEAIRNIHAAPDNRIRLTDSGRQQAVNTGTWLKENLNLKLDACYVSDFCRAQETAGLIGQSSGLNLSWRINVFFGERNWGDFPALPEDRRKLEESLRISNPRHWRPPVLGGQSLRELETTLRIGLMSLFRNHHGQAVLATGHGEQILGCMDIIEKLSEEQLSDFFAMGVPNGGIVHYSRRNPETGEIHKTFRWRRLVDPSNSQRFKELWNGQWVKVSRPLFSSQELLGLAEKQPRFLGNELKIRT